MSGGVVLARRGELDRGVEDCREGFAIWRGSGVVFTTPEFAVTLAELLLMQGRNGEAQAVLDDLDDIVTGTDEAAELSEYQRLRGATARLWGTQLAPSGGSEKRSVPHESRGPGCSTPGHDWARGTAGGPRAAPRGGWTAPPNLRLLRRRAPRARSAEGSRTARSADGMTIRVQSDGSPSMSARLRWFVLRPVPSATVRSRWDRGSGGAGRPSARACPRAGWARRT